MTSYPEYEYLETDSHYLEKYITSLVASANGVTGYGVPQRYTSFDGVGEAGDYLDAWAVEATKLHADGKHLRAGNLTASFELTDAGADIAGSARITGGGDVEGGLTVSSGDFEVTGGDSQLGGALNVVGATTLQDTLDVTGAATFADTLEVTGATDLLDSLHVVGAATLDDILEVGGEATFADTVEIDGATTLNAATTLTAGVLIIPAGAVGAPSLAIGEATTGLYRPAAAQLAVTLGGTQRALLTAVGLATGGAVVPTPVRPLHVLVGGATSAGITTGSNGTDAVVIDGGAANVALNIVVPATSGLGLLRFSTPTTNQRAAIYWDEGAQELNTIFGSTINTRIKSNALGFFNTAAATKQTVSGTRTGTLAQLQTVMANFLTAIATYGLITDSTS